MPGIDSYLLSVVGQGGLRGPHKVEVIVAAVTYM